VDDVINVSGHRWVACGLLQCLWCHSVVLSEAGTGRLLVITGRVDDVINVSGDRLAELLLSRCFGGMS
jgi:acyl-coenzyme A synthetase/AMP-(fatty) acid ligase